ncbi:NIL domain-containing protein [Thermodesulfobium sp.]|jgi:ferredoxin|uniref:4Fe-4S dicluster domain-containing protein n=1 Tax=Thermodesulfobium narugense TaxID=184064 RepID=A0A7C5PQS0_9BACT
MSSEKVKKKLILSFSPELAELPITYHLVKDFDLVVNILRAQISPEKEGRLMLEIEGERGKLERGISYLQSNKIRVDSLEKELFHDKELCVNCGLCVGVCASRALILDENDELRFIKEKCVMCGICVKVCPRRAFKIEL